ncbi:nuclear transport factor 2 family protein [Alteromonas gracilis]|uniref:nuclear transport factor 2 family protein n=1 Tax=Alteromonas gracilis TaxID=1479524 RepID=UPI0030D5623F
MNVISRFCKIYTDICQISPDDLATIYADNVLFIDPITTHHGLNEVKDYFDNLLIQAKSCKFDIAHVLCCESNDSKVTHVVNWTMALTLNKGDKLITLDGTTQLGVKDDIIVYHKDYYDVGEMVYEHVPLLGFVIKKIKGRLAS